MAPKLFKILFVIALSVFLLVACNNQATEEPMVTNGTVETTQPVTGASGILDEGELPAVVIPEQNQPETDEDVTIEPTEIIEPTLATEPTEPSATTKPTEPKPTETTSPPSEPTETEPSETPEPEPTIPSETTPPPTTDATEPPRLDEDELPPIPLF